MKAKGRVALTGGIATGKSYVRTRLEALGVPTIDADRLAHGAIAPGTPGLAAVVGRFGAGVLDADRQVNRAALGARIQIPRKLKRISAMTATSIIRRGRNCTHSVSAGEP